MEPLINIHGFQFGFKNQHLTIEKVHSVIAKIEQTFEKKNIVIQSFWKKKQYYHSAILDVAQVWHQNLICKRSKMLPGNYCKLLELYHSDRKFRASYAETTSGLHPTQAGVSQGVVLGPLLQIF